MKATLEFELPEDQEEFDRALCGNDYQTLIYDFDRYLREHIKYDETLSDEVHDAFEKIRDKLYELASDNNITI